MVFRAIHARRVWFLLLPLALLFTSPYVTSVLLNWFNAIGGNNLPPLPGALLAVVTFPFVIAMFAASYLLSQAQSYLLVSVAAVVICLLIVLNRRSSRAASITAGVVLTLVLVLPLAFRHEPNFSYLANNGYTVYAVPTQQTFADATVYGLLNILEMKGCRYDVLGWSTANILYYRSDCRFGSATFWRFDPVEPDAVQQVAGVTDELITQPETLLLPEFYSPSDHRSPDGRWIAAPWHKEAYEPEAVIVVSGPQD